ncbi:MAG: S9 family peptidase, partial [Bryobacteraceae bacterium]
TFGGWSPDGKLIAYSSTRRNGKDSDIYVMNPSDPKSARILLEVDSVGWGVEDWAPDSSRLIVERYRSADSNELYEVDVKTGHKRAITPQQPGVSFFYAKYSGDGKGFYAATNQSSDFRQLAYVDLSSGETTVLLPELKWDIAGIAVSKNGRRLAYTVNEGAAEVLHAMDTATRKELAVPRLPQGTIDRFIWHSNNKNLAFSMASARSPSDVHSIDLETGKLERWTLSETGGLDPEEFVEPELIRWKSFDGLTISGFYYKPPARFTGPRPVIIDIHGGPESQYQPGYLGRANYFLSEAGIAIIKPNVRGSSGYGKRFMNLDNGMKREDSVKDIGALLDWIGQQKDLDSERVMVMGGSYGGFMTLAAMTHYNDRFRCAVDVVGISNFVTFLEQTEAYRRDLRRAEYGDERDPKMRDFLSTVSPVN